MELNQLRYFQTVAKYEQMTKAAEVLCISQSSLSKTISMLERDIGAKLFDRLGNRIVLNQVGRAFLARVDRLLLELDDAVLEATSIDSGTVRFAANISGLCTNYIDAFIRQNPKVKLQQSMLDPEQMVAALENGELDCALSFTDISSEKISWTRLVNEEMLMLVSKRHPLAWSGEAPLSAFAQDLFVCNNSGFGVREILLHHCKAAGFQPDIVFDGNEPELAFKLVAENYGVMMISSLVYGWKMSMEIVDPPLTYSTAVRLSGPDCVRPLGLAQLNHHYISKTAEQFIQGLREYFASLQPPRRGGAG